MSHSSRMDELQQEQNTKPAKPASPVPFDGRLTFDEYRHVYQLVQRRQTLTARQQKRKKRRRVGWKPILSFVVLTLFFSILLLGLFLFSDIRMTDGLLGFILGGAATAFSFFVILLAWIGFIGQKREFKKAWELHGKPQLERSGTVDSDGLLLALAYERTETNWAAFQDLLVDGDVAILTYLGDASQFLCRAWFAAPEDWQAALAIIREHVPEIGVDESESSSVAHCTVCGKTQPKSEMLKLADRWNCVECKPQAVQKLREGVD